VEVLVDVTTTLVLGGATVLLMAALGVVLRLATGPDPAATPRQIAHHRDWTYQSQSKTWPGRWPDATTPGPPGFARAVTIVRGPVGATHFLAFTSLPAENQGRALAVAILRLHAALPSLAVWRDGIGRPRYPTPGQEDIATGRPSFDAFWRVRSENPEFVHALLTDRMVEWLGRPGRAPSFTVAGDDLVTWYDGHLDLDRLDERVAELAEFAQHVDADVWSRFGEVNEPEAPIPADL
jgi:hypothetical protein